MALAFDPVSILLEIGSKVIDRIFPDPVQKAQAQLELVKLQQSGELAQLAADTQLAAGQLDINKVEAASSSLFVSGWRPFIGWICGIGLGTQFIVAPLADPWYHIPTLDLSTLLTLLLGMLGLGVMRSVEKVKGTK